MKSYKLHIIGTASPITIHADRVKIDRDTLIFFIRENGADNVVAAYAPGTWHSFEEVTNASA